MAKGLIEHDTMTAIAEAIRSKNGETSGYTPADMPAAIGRISGGGEGYVFPADAFVIDVGDVKYMFENNHFYWFINDFIDRIQFINTGEVAYSNAMFLNSNKITVPIDFGHLLSRQQNVDSFSYKNMFQGCHNIPAIYNIPVMRGTTKTTNQLGNLVYYTMRAKHITFDTDNGIPFTCSWQKQTLDCSNYIGYTKGTYDTSILGTQYEINDASTYEAYKNHPKAYVAADKSEYAFYNHDSAVETINSLPDASAYLETSGGTINTIKFLGSAGSATDGGAINTLTAAEIAVAAAKGWTVSLV